MNFLIPVDIPKFDGTVSAARNEFVIVKEGEICYHIMVGFLNPNLFIFQWVHFHNCDSLTQGREGGLHVIL